VRYRADGLAVRLVCVEEDTCVCGGGYVCVWRRIREGMRYRADGLTVTFKSFRRAADRGLMVEAFACAA
jgi:hypothetical protein